MVKTAIRDREPRHIAAKRLTRTQIRFLIGGLLIALVAGYLIYTAAQGSAAYYMTISEIQQQGPQTRNVRVAGQVVGESIEWDPRNLDLRFEIVDGGGRMPVTYNGSRPDMFRAQAEVVLEGRIEADGAFRARTMILKCPSKYQEAN